MKPKCMLASALAALAISIPAAALDFSVEGSGAASTETNKALWVEGRFVAEHRTEDFRFLWDASIRTDGSYGGLFGDAFGTGGMSVLINEGGLLWSGGRFRLEAGRLAMRDIVDSPYALFLSGRGNAALTAALSYDDGRFFYRDRWMALNYDSESYDASTGRWPDRSAVLKTYGIAFGDLRIGFQDLVVYTNEYDGANHRGPVFDAEYFLNPAPGFLLQYVNRSMDSPWEKADRVNDNSIMGFFADWKRDDWSASAQLLVDDFNLNRIINPGSYQNPDKIAWMLGASLATDYGLFRLDHAGATKYCFSASTSPSDKDGVWDYGYTFYPSATFDLDGTPSVIVPEDNYVGYLHGENNLALRGSWSRAFGALAATAALELTLSGSKCPQDPWHELSAFPNGTFLLDDPVLEKRIVLSGRADWELGKGFAVFAAASLGYVRNKLALTSLTALDDDGKATSATVPVYVPSDKSAAIAALRIGGRWRLDF